ncbi:MAG: hypothetical protein QXW20_08385 [Ignisphaera sp.]
MSNELDKTVDRYYKVVEKCLIENNIYDRVIRKFPPMALRSAVREIVERFIKTENDVEQFDFCTFFADIYEFDSIADFIRYLDENRYIPPDPSREIAEAISQLERAAAELGMRLVKEEEWARITGQYERLKREVAKLREERKRLEERVKELEKMVEELKSKGSVKIPITKPEVKPATPKPPPRIRKPLRDTMTYEEFIGKLVHGISVRTNLLKSFIKTVLDESEKDLRMDYEKAVDIEYDQIESRYAMYIVSEYIPSRCVVANRDILSRMGVEVRYPNPVLMTRYERGSYVKVVERPNIGYVYSKVESWANDLRNIGYSVNVDSVPITPWKTTIIVDPSAVLDNVNAIICRDSIVAVNSDSVGLFVDAERKLISYARYKPYRSVSI